MGATQELATYAANLQFDDIPPSVRHRLRLHLLDAVGAALYGFRMPWAALTRLHIDEIAARGKSGVWNSPDRFAAPFAAFANTSATHAFELDDRRIASFMHPASATLPSGLATADEMGSVSGKALLTAIFAGYEVGLRVGKTVGRGSLARGFYPAGIGGAFAAGITAAKLRGYGASEICQVMNVAACQASGLYSPTPVKRLCLAHGTFAGMSAVSLVSKGCYGVDDILEREVGGFCAAFTDDADLALLTSALGADYETAKVELKPYVSSRPNHVAIDATLRIRADNPSVKHSDIEKIEIEVGSSNYDYGAGFKVLDVPAALMSVAYCAAVALIDGNAFLEQFTAARVLAEDVQGILSITNVTRNTAIDDMGLEARDHTVIRWHLRSGQVLSRTQTYAKGHPSVPLTDEEIVSKFHRLADPSVGRERANLLEAAFHNLEEIDTGQLGALLST